MKYLIIANAAGGLYRFRKDLISKLIKMGNNKIYIATPYEEVIKDLVDMGCEFINTPIDRRGVNPLTDAKLVHHLSKILKKISPDYVITYTIKPNIYAGYLARKKGIVYACNITGLGTTFQSDNWLKRMVIFMYKIALKNAKVVFFENEENRKIFTSLNIVENSRTHKLNGAGVNLVQFPMHELPKIEDKFHFIFVGRIMKEKGVDELFEAMKRLHREGYNCVLDVLGTFEENYKEVIDSYREEGWLEFYGYQEDVPNYIKNAHCCVLPSWHEGMSNTLLESAAIGRPLITSRIHGCMEAVIEGKTGFLCERKNVDSLYNAMKKMLLLSYDELQKMGVLGREHMTKVFDKNLVVEDTIKHL